MKAPSSHISQTRHCFAPAWRVVKGVSEAERAFFVLPCSLLTKRNHLAEVLINHSLAVGSDSALLLSTA
jgi:hypothetical protein